MTRIKKYRAHTGGLIAFGIIAFVLLSGMRLTDIKTLLWLHFAFLLLHQFEEYVYPGGFRDFYNMNIRNNSAITKFPLNDNGILLVNIAMGWTAYLLSAISGVKFLWLAIGLLGITVSNGIMHNFMFLRKRKYIPGMLTGLFLFIPFGLYVLIKKIETYTTENLILGSIVFVSGTALIPILIFTANKVLRPGRR